MSENNTTFAVVTVDYDANRPGHFMAQVKKQMHYKAAAKYAAQIILDPSNIRFDGWGKPYWNSNKVPGGIRLYDDVKFEVGGFSWWKGWTYFEPVREIPQMYYALMYVLKAMENARAEVMEMANQEMTPIEIAREFGLSESTVRKYIHQHREWLLENKVVRQADQRTTLCKRGWALNRWGQK